jgi:hypothetical protein
MTIEMEDQRGGQIEKKVLTIEESLYVEKGKRARIKRTI